MPQPTQLPEARKIVARLAAEFAAPGFPSGDLAALRRTNPDLPGRTPVLLRLLARHAPVCLDSAVNELGLWALVIHGMALMAPDHHHTRLPVGRSLRGNGPGPLYSELRLGRLLSPRGAAARS